jgi:phosphatidylglycerophosphate synthase
MAAARAGDLNASALLFATAAADHGGPAATLAIDGSTLVGRLLGQLHALGISTVWLVTRPEGKAAVESATRNAGPQVSVVASGDVAEDLRTTAEIADHSSGALIVASANVLTHQEALAGLLADPRIGSGILGSQSARWSSSPVRVVRQRVVSAGSPYHLVGQPTTCSLGFVKVDPGHVQQLVAASRHFANLIGEPDGLKSQLGPIGLGWRIALWQERVSGGREVAANPILPEPAEIELDLESEAEIEQRLRAAEENVVDLLVVGLVRSGVQLTLRALRGFFYATPVSTPSAASAARQLSSYDEDRIALDAAVKAKDGFFTTFFVSPYSKYVARFGARHGWTPNWVTAASFLIGGVAAACFALGSRAGLIAGAVLLQVGFTVDCVDGQLARYTRTFSKLGAWLDSVFDRSKEYVVYAGLAIGASRGFGEDVWALAVAALALQTLRHMLDFAYAERQQEAIDATPPLSLEEASDMGLPVVPTASDASHLSSSFGVPPSRGATAVAPQVPPSLTTYAAREAREAANAPRSALSTFAGAAVDWVRALDRWTILRWGKRVLVLPIGERFALISLTAAVWTPGLTFVVLLAWGSVAAAYAVVGRILSTVAR